MRMTNGTDQTFEKSGVVIAPIEDRLTAAERALPRRKFFNDMPDKGLFAAAAVLGFLVIMLLKIYEVLNSSIVAALAVGIMLVYGAISFQLPAIQMRPDRLGDNFYYLGFIYTLASLSAALFQLQTEANLQQLLGNFGIALVTTIVGVAGRVLFVQMRGELDEVEERVRRDLAAASLDLRGQLVTALREFETFHTGILQASNEAVARSAQQLEDQIEQVGKVAQSAIQRIDSRADIASARTERLAQLIDRLTAAIAELPSLSKIELPSERLRQQILSFTAELEMLVMELRTVTSHSRHNAAGRRRWYWPFSRVKG
jgi:methyl-accepting chemotaxis protein